MAPPQRFETSGARSFSKVRSVLSFVQAEDADLSGEHGRHQILETERRVFRDLGHYLFPLRSLCIRPTLLN